MIDATIKQDILTVVDRLQDELIGLTSDLVQIPSINPTYPGIAKEEIVGGETRVNQFLAPIMQSIGLKTDLWEEEAGRANLVGVYRGTAGGRSLLFNGHVDVVPPGPVDLWTAAAPWSGKITDSRVYGRGTTDMKGGIACTVLALKALLEAGYKPKGDVLIESVAGEEMMNTAIGTGAAIKRGYQAEAGIVVEPSGGPYRLAIVSTSPGTLILKVKVKGKAAHTLLRNELVRAGGLGAEAAVSAVDKAMIIYQALLKLEEEWGQTKCHPAYPRPGSFTICPTTFAGGLGGLAFIPEECYIQYVIWHAPQETGQQVKQEVEAQIDRYAQTDAWLRANPPTIDWQDFWWPPYDIPMDAPICQAAIKAYQEVLHTPAKACGFLGVDDASFLNLAGIPTITLGPGDARMAHTANESVEIRDLVDATKIFALTMVEWCGV